MIKNSYILLDTCVVNALLSREILLKEKIRFILNQFENNHNILCVSEFSKYELLRGATSRKKVECEKILKDFSIIPHNTERLDRSIRLYELYKNEACTINILHSISDIDVFIGSLIFTDQRPYLFTADFFDFPRPFFVEKDIFPVEYRKLRGNVSCFYYYLLQANI